MEKDQEQKKQVQETAQELSPIEAVEDKVEKENNQLQTQENDFNISSSSGFQTAALFSMRSPE